MPNYLYNFESGVHFWLSTADASNNTNAWVVYRRGELITFPAYSTHTYDGINGIRPVITISK